MGNYSDFLDKKAQLSGDFGFDPGELPTFLFDFQKSLVEWGLRRGRCAEFADTGLGKTAMQLVWAQKVIERTDKPVLLVTPLAVGAQTIREAHKFGIEAELSREGHIGGARVIVTNYERLHYFRPSDFSGMVCDESSAIKSFNGKHRAEVTEFMRTMPFRSLWTATAAPNDYIELGTSSEALGELGQNDMLTRFFKNDLNNSQIAAAWRSKGGKEKQKFRFKGHAETAFWRWVTSWARACRKPSDLGFDDGPFNLPSLIEREHVVEAARAAPGMLFTLAAANFFEERQERRRTIEERCLKAAELVQGDELAVIWCHLNDEGDMLSKIIPGAVQVSGSDSDDEKEDKLSSFSNGGVRVLVIKPRIAAFGLNWQHCAHVVTFASHSYEQYYQSVRRCWRFGQKRPVIVDLIASEGEVGVKDNMRRKAIAADKMFSSLVAMMNDSLKIRNDIKFNKQTEVPSWCSINA